MYSVLFSNLLLAQNAPLPCNNILTGQVIDHHDGTGLAFATIYISELKKGEIADSLGQYRFEGLCKGDYTLICTHLGCDSLVQTISIKGNMRQNFFLEHHAEELAAVSVVSSRHPTSVHSQATLSNDDLEKTRGNSIAESLTALAGVRTLHTGASVAKPIVQGLHSNRILTLNQGVRQEDQQWGAEHSLQIDPFSADQLTVLKGAATVAYGADALGGVVIVEPAALPDTAGIHGSWYAIGQTNGWGGTTAARLQGYTQKIGWRGQMSFSRLGDLKAPKYILSNTAMQTIGGSWAMAYTRTPYTLRMIYSLYLSNLGILQAAHIGNLTDLKHALASGEPTYIAPFSYAIHRPNQRTAHHLLKVELNRKFGYTTQFDFWYAAQLNRRREYDIRRSNLADVPSLALQLQTHTIEAKLAHRFNAYWRTIGGVMLLYQINTNDAYTGIRPLLPNYQLYNAGLYVLQRYTRKAWEAELGARYEHKYIHAKKYSSTNNLVENIFRFNNLVFSVGATCKPISAISLAASVGTAYRNPSVLELLSEGLHQGVAAIEEGNLNLVAEQSLKGSLTAHIHLPWGIDAEITTFAQPIKNYIYLVPYPEPRLTIRGAFPVFSYQQTDAWLRGGDLQLSVKRVHWQWVGKAAFVRGTDRDTGSWLIYQPADYVEQTLTYIEPKLHRGWHNLQISASHTWVNKQTRYSPQFDFAPPPPAYMLWGATVEVAKKLAKHRQLLLSFRVDNLANTAYRDYLNRFRYFADEKGIGMAFKIKYDF